MKSSHEVRRGRWRDWIVCFGSCFVLFVFVFYKLLASLGCVPEGFWYFHTGRTEMYFLKKYFKNILNTARVFLSL